MGMYAQMSLMQLEKPASFWKTWHEVFCHELYQLMILPRTYQNLAVIKWQRQRTNPKIAFLYATSVSWDKNMIPNSCYIGDAIVAEAGIVRVNPK